MQTGIMNVFFNVAIFTCAMFAELTLGAEMNVANGNDKETLRVITYNIMKFEGYPKTTGWQGCPVYESNETIFSRVRGQIPLRIALELALYRPDIISLQEANSEEKVAEIAEYLGMNYAFFPGNGRWPGAILTKYKIIEPKLDSTSEKYAAQELFTRHWGRVYLDADGQKIVVHTVHLHPVDGEIRKTEIQEIIKTVKADIGTGNSVLLMGDLNHRDNDAEYKLWVEGGLKDTAILAGIDSKYTVPSTGPMKRIDYIWACGPILEKLAETRVLNRGAFKMNFDDTPYFALSDHLPVLAIFND